MDKLPPLNEISTPALAYLGDSVIEIAVRRHLICRGLSTSSSLNRAALSYVSAPKQAEAMARLLPILTPEEEAVFKRGRNIGHSHTPKAASVTEYRSATGMETLFAYLYLSGNQARIDELFDLAYPENDTLKG